MVTPVAMEPTLGYHPYSTGFLTCSRNPAGGQCLTGSLTGAVASERVSDVYKRQAVHGFKADENDVTFVVEGPENASITLELEPETEYKVHVDDVYVGKNKTNLGGKMSISVDLEEGRPVKVDVKRAFD